MLYVIDVLWGGLTINQLDFRWIGLLRKKISSLSFGKPKSFDTVYNGMVMTLSCESTRWYDFNLLGFNWKFRKDETTSNDEEALKTQINTPLSSRFSLLVFCKLRIFSFRVPADITATLRILNFICGFTKTFSLYLQTILPSMPGYFNISERNISLLFWSIFLFSTMIKGI